MSSRAGRARWGDPVAWAIYLRLGPRYPLTIVLFDLAVQYVVFAIAVALLPLWIDMSAGKFVVVLVAALALQTVYIAFSAPVLRARVRPMEMWLRGNRTREAAEQAWQAAASLPQDFFGSSLNTAWRVALNVAWAGFATWQLDLPGYAFPALAAAAAVSQLYAIAQVFFMMESGMQPLLFEIAQEVDDVPIDDRHRVPLRRRLLAAMPAITIVSALAVAGLAGAGNADVGDLAVEVLLALGVTATVALGMTFLLTNSIVGPIANLRAATEQVAHGDLDVRVPVVSSDETGELTRAFNRMVAGLRERERIREAFGTYVDRDVAEHILRQGVSLAGEQIEVTIMFIDIRNFTSFAEHASAPDVVATINRLFERAVPLIRDHGGHVDKFVGDGLMAVFGAPRRQQDHADQALVAALEIDQAVRDEFSGELEIGIGLNSGTVVAGNVGGAGRLEFSVIGDAVNVAARVEAATRQTGDVILLAEAVKRLLHDGEARLEARPALPLKGKREPMTLYAPRTAPRPEGQDRS